MCGICGFIHYDDHRTEEERHTILTRMNRAMTHRGPDDEGYCLAPPTSLAMRRLSIIDRAGGHQPIANHDGTVWIVFNGEIYNYLELRRGLEDDGYCFKTHSDTEVILHLYEKKGSDFVCDLNGMFAIAIWDSRSDTLLLARDRFGKKPLYYAECGHGLVFGSELKALLQYPELRRELDPDGLLLFLTYDYVPYPYSIFKRVKKLPPGHVLRYHQGQTGLTQYWTLAFHDHPPPNPSSCAQLAKTLRSKLEKAVEYRLISEVPLGVFLSGGIDSSLITALMCRLRPPHEVKTFSIHFEEKSFDESAYSTEVAKYLGTDHHSRLFQSRDLIDLVPRLARSLDEPFADASIFPTYLLSRFTREHVTVALSGDGADELFAGYPTFQASRVLGYYQKLPQGLRKVIERMIRALPSSTQNLSLDFKLKQFISGAIYKDIHAEQAWLSPFLPNEQSDILSRDFLSTTLRDPYTLIDTQMNDCNSMDVINRIIYFYSKFYLAEDILTKTDRASMANSLEVRAPFLDKDFVDFAQTIPSKCKLARFTTKAILKQAARGLLPDRIIDRPKKGFGIPVAHWFRYELKEFVAEHLRSKWMQESGIFQMATINRLLDEHHSGRRDHRKKLFPLLMFSLWRNNFL